ncbi:MAG TPA: hypothetical protein DDZ22_17300 [Massilia sp.]|nr:hypothetical protein [Massilia sp.]
MTTEKTPDEIIDALGGTSEVARLCEVQPPSVSEWRRLGIPKARLAFLRLARPAVFAGLGMGEPAPARRSTDSEPDPGRASRTPPSRDRLMTASSDQAPAPVVEPKP